MLFHVNFRFGHFRYLYRFYKPFFTFFYKTHPTIHTQNKTKRTQAKTQNKNTKQKRRSSIFLIEKLDTPRPTIPPSTQSHITLHPSSRAPQTYLHPPPHPLHPPHVLLASGGRLGPWRSFAFVRCLFCVPMFFCCFIHI